MPPCAVIAATADDSEATRRACLAAGMDGHLVKPLLLPALAAELQRVCAGHGRHVLAHLLEPLPAPHGLPGSLSLPTGTASADGAQAA